jgi:predicted ATP-grasp superfamily ATP-dependent carboligase
MDAAPASKRSRVIAVVTDAQLRSAVAGLRGLGRAGVDVLALAPRRSAPGLWSRYATRRTIGADPEREPLAYLYRLAGLARAYDGVVVYPAREAGIAPLLDTHLPEGVRPAFGSREAVALLRDKSALPDLAAGAGFGSPPALVCGTADDVRAADLPPHVVVKPVTLPAGLGTAAVAYSPRDLERILAKLHPGDTVIAQPFVEGRSMSLALVTDNDGALVAGFQEEVVRTWPPEAGSFAMTVSVAPDPALFEAATTLLRDSGYSGLAQLDVILTADGPVLLDVNTRFYACLPNALRCGVNLPAAWHAVVSGTPFDAPANYPEGVRYRWLEADLTAAAYGMPGRLRDRPRGPVVGAMWAADDPVAGALLAIDAVGQRVARRVPFR